ncbi:MAG: [FeFe] hydrogenase H-cluster radical SAM maturase HydE [Bacillota bacterium]
MTKNSTKKSKQGIHLLAKEAANALKKAADGKDLNLGDLVALLAVEGETKRQLFSLADETRAKYMGNQVHLRGIIEFSNYCVQNCLYCGLRKSNRKLFRYRMLPEEVLGIAKRAAQLGYRTIVLQSGEDPCYDAETLAELIGAIKKETGVAITVSVGERRLEDYRLWREAGADRYLLKHETADPGLYVRLRPGHQLASRVKRLQWLRQLGYQIGSGNMVGLPGQTLETLAADLILLKELDVEMAGLGPFVPHGDTPLAGARAGNVDLNLKVLAVARLVLPWAHLPATTSIGTLDPQGRQKALRVGANVVMPNVTPARYREHYQIYPGKICLQEEPEHCRSCVEGWITAMGREVACDYGHSPKPGDWTSVVPVKAG